MTLLQNQQLNDDDLELLSAYIDNQLVAGERGALEERLRREPGLRGALEELRGTVAVLRELEPLRPPRSFTLDPAAFAPRPSRLFSWMRLGATLASVLLALTFAIDFIGSGGASAPAAAPQLGGGSAAERRALTQATAAPAAASAPEPTAAPAAPAEALPAPAGAAAPAAAAPTAAPAPTTGQNSDTTITAPSALNAAAPTAAPAGQPTPIPTQEQGAPQSYAPPDTSTKAAPAEPAGGQAPAAQEPGLPPTQLAPQPAIQPLRLIEIGLASLALVLGLGALWVRRRGR